VIALKSKREIDIMRDCGKILAAVLKDLRTYAEPGMTTLDLDKRAENLIRELGGTPAFKGYRGFPGTLCVSLNDEVVHGIPSERKLKEGDVLSCDLGVKYKNYFTDAARTWALGSVPDDIARLIRVAREAVYEGAWHQLQVGKKLGDVSHAIEVVISGAGFGIVRDFVGHGIGRDIHEEPQVPNYGRARSGLKLEAGLVLAIEPMVTEGDHDVMIIEDNWTVVTCDGGLSAHHEDTIVLTEDGPEVLTQWDGETDG